MFTLFHSFDSRYIFVCTQFLYVYELIEETYNLGKLGVWRMANFTPLRTEKQIKFKISDRKKPKTTINRARSGR